MVEALVDALMVVAETLDADRCWFYEGRFHFPLADGWSFAISPDDAGRFRCEACRNGRPRDTLWAQVGAHERLAALAAELSTQVVR